MNSRKNNFPRKGWGAGVLWISIVALLAALSGAARAQETVHPLRSGIDVANIDHRVRPQDDFYRYVNGRWFDTVTIPADRERVTPSSQLDDIIKLRLKQIVEKAGSPSPGGSADQRKIATLYADFLDEPAREKLGTRPMARECCAQSIQEVSEPPVGPYLEYSCAAY